jgi:hypothetical protein
MIVGPDCLLNADQMAEVRANAGQAGFQATKCLLLAEAMRNGDD